jgi:hypothetical protein
LIPRTSFPQYSSAKFWKWNFFLVFLMTIYLVMCKIFNIVSVWYPNLNIILYLHVYHRWVHIFVISFHSSIERWAAVIKIKIKNQIHYWKKFDGFYALTCSLMHLNTFYHFKMQANAYEVQIILHLQRLKMQ